MERYAHIALLVGLLLVLAVPLANAAQSAAPNTCTLGGQFTSKWVNVNLIILAIGFMIAGAAYAISRILPPNISARVTGITKVEVVQFAISLFIIFILISMTTVSCTLSTNLGNKLLGQSGLNPFQFSEHYVENLSMNTGLNLLGYIYTTGVSYAIYAAVINAVWKDLPSLNPLQGTTTKLLGVSIEPTFSYDLGYLLSSLSSMYLQLFSTILLTMIGVLFVQWLALPVIQSLAFTVILPFAIIVRSVAFAASGSRERDLRHIGNALLALSIALYLIYPLMIMFNSYAVSYIFSSSNPLYSCTNCLSSALSTAPITQTYFSQQLQSSYSMSFFGGFTLPPITNFITGPLFNNIGAINPSTAMEQAQHIISNVAMFIFMGVFMFGVDLTVTIGFATSFTKALNAGVDGAPSFWNQL